MQMMTTIAVAPRPRALTFRRSFHPVHGPPTWAHVPVAHSDDRIQVNLPLSHRSSPGGTSHIDAPSPTNGEGAIACVITRAWPSDYARPSQTNRGARPPRCQ